MLCSVERLEGEYGSGKAVRPSPDGRWLAVAGGSDGVVRVLDAGSLDTAHVFHADNRVEVLEWAADSRRFLTAAISARWEAPSCQVWSLSAPTKRVRITEGEAGLAGALWAPHGRHVVTIANFGLHATAWDTASGGSSTVLDGPVHGAKVRGGAGVGRAGASGEGERGVWVASAGDGV
jgi:WD40 repeat protein